MYIGGNIIIAARGSEAGWRRLHIIIIISLARSRELTRSLLYSLDLCSNHSFFAVITRSLRPTIAQTLHARNNVHTTYVQDISPKRHPQQLPIPSTNATQPVCVFYIVRLPEVMYPLGGARRRLMFMSGDVMLKEVGCSFIIPTTTILGKFRVDL